MNRLNPHDVIKPAGDEARYIPPDTVRRSHYLRMINTAGVVGGVTMRGLDRVLPEIEADRQDFIKHLTS